MSWPQIKLYRAAPTFFTVRLDLLTGGENMAVRGVVLVGSTKRNGEWDCGYVRIRRESLTVLNILSGYAFGRQRNGMRPNYVMLVWPQRSV